MVSEAFANWATGIGIILGIFGASWKWFFAEMIRRRTDHPAMEGLISIKMIPRDDETRIVQVTCNWKNISLHKIFLDTDQSKIYIYDLIDQFNEGPIDIGNKDTKYMYCATPYQHLDCIFYEPGTDSNFVASFILPVQKSYAARAFLRMDEERMGMKDIVWSRDAVFSTN